MDNRLLTGQWRFHSAVPQKCYGPNTGNARFGLSESQTFMSAPDTQAAQEHNTDCKVFIIRKSWY